MGSLGLVGAFAGLVGACALLLVEDSVKGVNHFNTTRVLFRTIAKLGPK